MDGTCVIGSKVDVSRTVDGEFAEFAFWDRILTAREGLALTKGRSPKFFPKRLVHYIRMVRGVKDEMKGVTVTVTGTTVVSKRELNLVRCPVKIAGH